MSVDYRATPWRQGSFLSNEDARQLFPKVFENGENPCVILVSHDCDIAQPPESEPLVEVIFAYPIDQLNGNFSRAKNPRRLHLTATTPQNGDAKFQLEAMARNVFPKEDLPSLMPLEDFRLEADALRTLALWMAARYDRAAFSDGFEDVLKNADVPDKLGKLVKRFPTQIDGVYFNIINEDEIAVGEKTFELEILILYHAGVDPDELQPVLALKEKFVDIFKKAFLEPKQKVWRGLELVSCETKSTAATTVEELRAMKEFKTDHLSVDNPKALGRTK